MFLKVYASGGVLCSLAGGVDINTFKKWVFSFLNNIMQLEGHVIVFENRFKKDRGNRCLMSVDCADFRVPNSGAAFASHKYKKKSALRYELGICILTGDLVWLNGPYEAGRWPDIEIFRDVLANELAENEACDMDDGYIGEHPERAYCPGGFPNDPLTAGMHSRIRRRQETINARSKFWGCLRQVWRHELADHCLAMTACCIIDQLSINAGEKLFPVDEYREPPIRPHPDDTSSDEDEHDNPHVI